MNNILFINNDFSLLHGIKKLGTKNVNMVESLYKFNVSKHISIKNLIVGLEIIIVN